MKDCCKFAEGATPVCSVKHEAHTAALRRVGSRDDLTTALPIKTDHLVTPAGTPAITKA